MKKIFRFLMFSVLLTISFVNNVDAISEYDIDKYDVNIIVNEDNTLDITENITAYFNVEKHGIIRKIPYDNTVYRLDGTSSKVHAKITDIKVNEPFNTTVSDGNKEIKIGSSNYTLTGSKEYEIKYKYDLGNDKNKDFDELYFNIIGTEWDTSISDITFSITMPKDFDESNLGFSSGVSGSTDNDNIIYTVENNVITGSYLGILDSYNGITLRVELPNEYFTIKKSMSKILIVLIPLISLLASFVFWLLFGRNSKAIETIEFYPPENYNSLELAFLYKGNVDNNDIVSLLIYLASKGYIKIIESDDSKMFTKKGDFEVEKIKDYDGDNGNEKKFMENLFPGDITKVTSSQLKNSFYHVINDIKSDINCKEFKEKIITKTPVIIKIIMLLLMLTTVFAIVSIPIYEYGDSVEIFSTLFIVLFYIPFYAVLFMKSIPKVFKIFWGVVTIPHSLVFFATTPLFKALADDSYYILPFIIGIAVVIGIGFIYNKILAKRTDFGNEILGKIRGFKRFLETAEKEKLEALVLDDPAYFYNILPYTYVLGVSDKWIKKFETIAIAPPEWYSTNSSFSVSTFATSMNLTMTSARNVMASTPYSSSGGGSSSSGSSSGGGSSGGGSGGGGGSSW